MAGHKKHLKQEAKAEIKASIEVGGTSFNDILRVNTLASKYLSYEDKKGKKGNVLRTEQVYVRGQDIGSNKVWQEFLKSKGYIDASLISLVDHVNHLTEEYDTFLDTSYTDRYRNLDGEGKIWRYKVVCLAVKYHIMENKLAGYKEASEDDDEDYFSSIWVAYFYGLMQAIRLVLRGTAKEINHIIKDPDQADLYIDKIFSHLDEHLRQSPFPQRDAILRLIHPDIDDEDEDNSTGVAI